MKDSKKKFYFVGIGGVGMSAVAGLLKSEGHEVTGSDQALYPPSSTLLEKMRIPVKKGYHQSHVEEEKHDIYVIGNALSVTNSEVSYILEKKFKYMSFPQLISEFLLETKSPVIVCGTHGKTTTSSWLVSCLTKLGADPSYLIGGTPIGFDRGFSFSKADLFVLEGDEYDTAFFDKKSKFLHYKPKYVILNNIEFDHADIFKNLEEIYATFSELLSLVSSPGNIVANIDDKGVCAVLKRLGLYDQVYKVSCLGLNKDSDLFLMSQEAVGPSHSEIVVREKDLGVFTSQASLVGSHNISNALQCLSLLFCLKKQGFFPKHEPQSLAQSLGAFSGVQKRLEKVGFCNGALIYRDFAHHPTAVKLTLQTLKQLYPKARLIAGFEPKNASSRRNIFLKEYKEALSLADQVFFIPPVEDTRLKEEERMDIYQLQKEISAKKAHVFSSKDKIKDWCFTELNKDDICIFLSCGDFMGVPFELV